MDFRDVVRRRRMARKYTSEPVAEQAVTRILDAARRAPSAGFAQGQSFIVVTDSEVRAAVADAGREAAYKARGFDPWLSAAPVLVVVCIDERAYRARYDEPDKELTGGAERWPIPYGFVDGGAALMLLLLAAVDEGLAAGFAGIHGFEGLEDVLGIPEGVVPIGVVTIGHPAPDRGSSSVARGRKPLDEVIHREKW